MVKHAVYVTDSNIPVSKVFNISSYNAKVAITGAQRKNISVSFNQALKKHIEIHCINKGYGNTESSINLIANKAIDLSHLKLDTASYDNVPQVLEQMANKYEKEEKIYETVINMI